eukprot:TRINITY_DN1422_c0_g1_i1.p1 TRINITY_DN1422_c0_g1~~TRINITY_DN1422_c0_g1_i1.p1  ORF type:complete len:218 (+),score=24.57 TRINITY_DN1422_c0_g1_i1:1020-1673(+)
MMSGAVKAAPAVQGTPLWLGETDSAVGGGQNGVSNTFAGTFEYLDKLGQVSANGHKLVFRQTMCNYNYGLISSSLDPRPSYWALLLFKTVVGTAALRASIQNGPKDGSLRYYGFCSSTKGYAVALLINLSKTSSLSVSVATSQTDQGRQGQIYTLTSSSLEGTDVYLNGASQSLTPAADGTAPPLTPRLFSPTSTIQLPPLSQTFAMIPVLSSSPCA